MNHFGSRGRAPHWNLGGWNLLPCRPLDRSFRFPPGSFLPASPCLVVHGLRYVLPSTRPCAGCPTRVQEEVGSLAISEAVCTSVELEESNSINYGG